MGGGGGRGGERGEGDLNVRGRGRRRGGREKDFFELVSFFHPAKW